MADIDRVHFRRAALQKAIGEAAGRCANVERDLAANIDLEKVQRAFQFERASAGITREFRDRDLRLGLNKFGRFIDYAVPHSYFARHDGALRALAAFKKTPRD